MEPTSLSRILKKMEDQKLIVNVNEDLFSWVLENLIKNAIDAMRPGSQGKIVISALKVVEKKELYIEVTDNGKGIPSNEKRKIFKPGYSTKKRGWGLGLSLAKRIIENYHGGRLILKESKINKGSTFRISLKLHA